MENNNPANQRCHADDILRGTITVHGKNNDDAIFCNLTCIFKNLGGLFRNFTELISMANNLPLYIKTLYKYT